MTEHPSNTAKRQSRLTSLSSASLVKKNLAISTSKRRVTLRWHCVFFFFFFFFWQTPDYDQGCAHGVVYWPQACSASCTRRRNARNRDAFKATAILSDRPVPVASSREFHRVVPICVRPHRNTISAYLSSDPLCVAQTGSALSLHSAIGGAGRALITGS